ncbi:T9SS C-terminal target domain-containing protein [Rufibacter immobilis]|uniref:T9SS C-terminal target domain-containing protein n=1 Tax=Rufibacter immobilis TaxID=1348778 RepID=A0A3M9N5U5_9BACT|nr:T9SS type A sorting domain-containing protein [Rufibacter immobilis]RNI32368.1 T9SS C-terminal target domain-containing protein [Rufibacter immobilis]
MLNRVESFRSLQAPLSLSNLTWLGQSLSPLTMNDSTASGKTYYWVPFGVNNRGSGAWSELGHWATTSGGKVKHTTLPTAADDVVFDLNSFLFTGQKVTVDVEANAKNISWVNIRSTTLEGSGAALNVYGSFQVHSNLLLAGPAGFTINFKSATPETPINLLNKSFPGSSRITFEGSGGWILQSQLSAGQGSSITLVEGTLKTNNQNISINTFRSIGEKARTLELGTTTINNMSTWDVSSSLNLSATESKLVLNGPGTHTFNGGDQVYRSVVLHGPESFVNNSNTFKELSLPINITTDSTAGNILTLESGQTQTIETLSTLGSAPYTTIQSSVKGSNAAFNFTSLGFCTDYLIVSDVHATGPGNYFAGLNSENKGNNNGWHFITCATNVYSPKKTADFDTVFTTIPVVSDGSNKWQEIKFNGELVGAIRDGGNALGEVTVDFTVSADSSRTVKNAGGAEISLMPRNWRVSSTNPPASDKPVSIRVYGLQSEFSNYQAATGSVAALTDLFFTSYSNQDSTENCAYLDNTAAGITTLISNASFATAGNYFTAELTGLTDFTELYLHNGGTAIDFEASKPAPPVVEQPTPGEDQDDEDEELEPEEDPTDCSIIKLKWNAHPRSKKLYYELEVATDLFKGDFKVIGKFQKNNSKHKAQTFELKDSKTGNESIRYYRLKMYDAKGRKYYSRILIVRFNCGVQVVQASPNPFTDLLKLSVSTPKAGDLNIKLISSNGKESMSKRVMVPKGKSETEVRVDPKMKPGLYYLFTELNGKIITQRILKK